MKFNIKRAEPLNTVYDNLKIKQYSKITYLGCILDKSLSGKSIVLNVLSKFNSRLVFLTLHAALNAYELFHSAQYLDCIFCGKLHSSKSKSATLFHHLVSSRCKYLSLSGQAVFFFFELFNITSNRLVLLSDTLHERICV